MSLALARAVLRMHGRPDADLLRAAMLHDALADLWVAGRTGRLGGFDRLLYEPPRPLPLSPTLARIAAAC